jgi:hypothetical protein
MEHRTQQRVHLPTPKNKHGRLSCDSAVCVLCWWWCCICVRKCQASASKQIPPLGCTVAACGVLLVMLACVRRCETNPQLIDTASLLTCPQLPLLPPKYCKNVCCSHWWYPPLHGQLRVGRLASLNATACCQVTRAIHKAAMSAHCCWLVTNNAGQHLPRPGMAQLMYQCHHADKGLLYLHTGHEHHTPITSASAADPMNGIFSFGCWRIMTW